jgi:hypothetical protein
VIIAAVWHAVIDHSGTPTAAANAKRITDLSQKSLGLALPLLAVAALAGCCTPAFAGHRA